MRKVSWWDAWVDDDMSWREARRHNETVDAMNALADNGMHLASRLDAQQKEIAVLRAALKVLVQTLGETGAVDASVLKYRLEAAIEDAATRNQGDGQLSCAGCSRYFPVSATNITPVGSMCDECFEKSPYS